MLEVSALDVRYGRNHAVKSLDMALTDNAIVTVLGANGAGKSSLLKSIMGIVPNASGSIHFGGQDITRWSVPQRVRAGLALVPEGRQILTSLTVHENLLMGAYPRKRFSTSETNAIYDRFDNLAQRRDMSAAVLSGGEQQMLAIGRALLAKPRLMMLDEPSLGLSPLLVKQLFDLLRELHAEGLSLLLVEQNTHMALQIARYGYVLELGAVTLEGSPEELQQNRQLKAAYLGS
ncbi:ABC transporter ATP-binding protein [Chromatiales bacterium (ex Bugula neritina AB1)]|nr:ABC transporter ATP-binding protein [Chromatiales bacterium (ex Bugula neritina AB1)]